MRNAERTLVVVLRATALLLLVAVVPVVMPRAWMTAIHRGLGLGDLPTGPVVDYMARSLSALYAVHGALVLFVSFDVRRYLPLVKFLGIMGIAFGAIMLPLDWLIGLPAWWIAGEGPMLAALGALVWWLAAKVDAM